MIMQAAFAIFFAAFAVAAPPLGGTPSNVYDLSAERAFEGLVTRTAHSIDGTMYFTLKTGDADIEVQLGPRTFIEKSEFKLKLGERVSVIGVPAILQVGEVLLAREVRCSRGVFTIRDRNGEPLWELNRPIQMDPDRTGSMLCEMIELNYGWDAAKR